MLHHAELGHDAKVTERSQEERWCIKNSTGINRRKINELYIKKQAQKYEKKHKHNKWRYLHCSQWATEERERFDFYKTFPLERSREGSGDKWEVREGEREWKTPTLAHKRSAFPSEETTANSIKAGLWRKLTSAVRMNPFWRLRILYLIGQHTNEAISIATPNAGALITGCGCQGNSIRVSEGANEENMELSRPPHTPN